MDAPQGRPHSGFAVLEVLLIVVVLGVAAAAILPRLAVHDEQALADELRRNLDTLRKQIDLYAQDHGGQFPSWGSTDPQSFDDAMLLSSDPDGTTGDVGTKPFGPYLISQVPANPYTGGRRVRFVADVPTAPTDDSREFGWLYDPARGRIKANVTGSTPDGTPLDEL
jgi:type II secretory pathway pseudopilin PulG